MMPPFYRILEISVYSLLNFLPYLFLALYPFREHLRYSRRATCMLAALVALLQMTLGLLASFSPTDRKGFVSASSTALYFLFYFWSVRAHPGKTLFTLLMLSNIANLVVVCSKCLEGQIFPWLAAQTYRWSFTVLMAAVQAVILIPLFLYIRNVYSDAVEKEADASIWRYLWLIPATFYLLWFYHLYGSGQSGLDVALQPANALFLLCINLGAFLIYHIVARLLSEYCRNMELEQQNHMLLLENLQYVNLKDRIQETRRAEHDLRHHMALMAAYLEDGEYDRLRAYLDEYRSSLPEDSQAVFCRNHTANLLLSYFARQAADAGVGFAAYGNLPADLGIAESDLSVILGNLLENALQACMAQEGFRRQIVFRGKMEGQCLLVTVDNTFEGELRQDPNGALLSTKRGGSGLGLESVRHIAARYGGMLRTECRDGMFCASVLLKL